MFQSRKDRFDATCLARTQRYRLPRYFNYATYWWREKLTGRDRREEIVCLDLHINHLKSLQL